jgi:hypothetical protein
VRLSTHPVSRDARDRMDFVPLSTIIAFAFIGVGFTAGLLARCFASNRSQMRNSQTSDLMIYQAAPRAAAPAKVRRSSVEQSSETNGPHREQNGLNHDPTKLVGIQRGPKNL